MEPPTPMNSSKSPITIEKAQTRVDISDRTFSNSVAASVRRALRISRASVRWSSNRCSSASIRASSTAPLGSCPHDGTATTRPDIRTRNRRIGAPGERHEVRNLPQS